MLNDSCVRYTFLQQNIIAVFMVLFGINFSIYYLLLLREFSRAFFNEELRAYLGIVTEPDPCAIGRMASRKTRTPMPPSQWVKRIYYLLLLREFSRVFFNEELRAYLGIVTAATLLIGYNTLPLFNGDRR